MNQREAWQMRLGEGWRITLFQSKGAWIGYLRNVRTQQEKVLGPYGSLELAKETSPLDAARVADVVVHPNMEWTTTFHSSTMVRRLEEKRKEQRRSRFTSILSVVMGLTAAIAALVTELPVAHFVTRDSDFDKELIFLKTELSETDARFQALLQSSASSPDAVKVSQQVASLSEDVQKLKSRLGDYEVALGDDPAKKLALPLLRKDMDTLRDEHKADITALHDEMTRTFDIMKWLLGLLGVGSVLSGISNWFGRPAKTEKEA